MLQIVDQIPSGFLEIDAKRLYQVLPQPTLVHLLGTRREPVFISVLLHGNMSKRYNAGLGQGTGPK